MHECVFNYYLCELFNTQLALLQFLFFFLATLIALVIICFLHCCHLWVIYISVLVLLELFCLCVNAHGFQIVLFVCTESFRCQYLHMLQVMATSHYHDHILAEIKLQSVSSASICYTTVIFFAASHTWKQLIGYFAGCSTVSGSSCLGILVC